MCDIQPMAEEPSRPLTINSKEDATTRPSDSKPPNHNNRKHRKHSERSMGNHRFQGKKRCFKHDKMKHQRGAIKLPTKFLLGGNITDPLNLNSMNDETVNRLLNAETPVSSPLPTPSHRKSVEVIIPPNINDPLNLNSGEEIDLDFFTRVKQSGKKKRKNKRHKSCGGDNNNICQSLTTQTPCEDIITPLSIDTSEPPISKGNDFLANINNKLKRVVDKIVSPAIPQYSPKPKRKRTVSDASRKGDLEGPSESKQRRIEGEKPQAKKKSSHPSNKNRFDQPKFKSSDDKFIYGNYNQYYGKRNANEDDDRLHHFENEWFFGKDVLDVGCNIGHITLSIARNFHPRTIDGIDIDGNLISIARKNVKHYVSKEQLAGKNVPVSLPITHGPVATTALPAKNEEPKFPNNVNFVQGNYVIDRDELLELQKEEYDVILALSITKWIHLNFGDSGMKRCFKRMFRQLRPGGKLILEPQSFVSYKKKKRLNENIFENYQAIQLKPEQFTKYLLSPEIGFIRCVRIETPFNKSKGFQRPIFVLTKPDSNYTTPMPVTESRGVTPLMNIDCAHGYTPGHNFGYGLAFTPSAQRFTPHWEAAMFAAEMAASAGNSSYLFSRDVTSTVSAASQASPDVATPSESREDSQNRTPETIANVVKSEEPSKDHGATNQSPISSSSCGLSSSCETCCSGSSDSPQHCENPSCQVACACSNTSEPKPEIDALQQKTDAAETPKPETDYVHLDTSSTPDNTTNNVCAEVSNKQLTVDEDAKHEDEVV